jgi:hypothetical protein
MLVTNCRPRNVRPFGRVRLGLVGAVLAPDDQLSGAPWRYCRASQTGQAGGTSPNGALAASEVLRSFAGYEALQTRPGGLPLVCELMIER